ncbi:MAG: hypothetical protein IPQ18_14755 [Saprospiraceae bacterium]|nr:hypothetical protein [Saprospiraceae bacterium]
MPAEKLSAYSDLGPTYGQGLWHRICVTFCKASSFGITDKNTTRLRKTVATIVTKKR